MVTRRPTLRQSSIRSAGSSQGRRVRLRVRPGLPLRSRTPARPALRRGGREQTPWARTTMPVLSDTARQISRPTTIPTGMPSAIPMHATVVACHATAAASWRRVNPRVLRIGELAAAGAGWRSRACSRSRPHRAGRGSRRGRAAGRRPAGDVAPRGAAEASRRRSSRGRRRREAARAVVRPRGRSAWSAIVATTHAWLSSAAGSSRRSRPAPVRMAPSATACASPSDGSTTRPTMRNRAVPPGPSTRYPVTDPDASRCRTSCCRARSRRRPWRSALEHRGLDRSSHRHVAQRADRVALDLDVQGADPGDRVDAGLVLRRVCRSSRCTVDPGRGARRGCRRPRCPIRRRTSAGVLASRSRLGAEHGHATRPRALRPSRRRAWSAPGLRPGRGAVRARREARCRARARRSCSRRRAPARTGEPEPACARDARARHAISSTIEDSRATTAAPPPTSTSTSNWSPGVGSARRASPIGMSGDASHAPNTAARRADDGRAERRERERDRPLGSREPEGLPGVALLRAERDEARDDESDDDERGDRGDAREHGEADREDVDRLAHAARRHRGRLDLVDHRAGIVADRPT